MLDIIMCILVVVEILATIVIGFLIADKADKDRNKYITTALKNYIKELFISRNYFGIVLSTIVFIIGIPAFLMIIYLQAMACIVKLLKVMWKLGNKK